ncbi:MAG: response regulator [Bacteroidia bacterium]
MLNLHEQKIFIVDDEELILSATRRRLQKMGFEDVTAFGNGTDAINALIEEPFLVLLDYEMEGLNGFEVLRKIKRYNPNTYVIMMSAQEDISNAVDTLKYGAFDYIIKGDDDVNKLMEAMERIYKIEERILAPRKSIFSKILSIT